MEREDFVEAGYCILEIQRTYSKRYGLKCDILLYSWEDVDSPWDQPTI